MLDLYVPFMIALNFAWRCSWHSYELLLRYTHCFSYGLLTRKNFSSIIPYGYRFLSEFPILADTSETQPRSCFLCFERISGLTWNVLRYSILNHHSLFSSSRTPGRFAMVVCYKASHVITSCKWLTEASCSYVAPTQSTNSELIRRQFINIFSFSQKPKPTKTLKHLIKQ